MAIHSFRHLAVASVAMLVLALATLATPVQAKRLEEPTFDRFIVRFTPGSTPRGNATARQHLLDDSGRPLAAQVSQLRRLAVGADVVRTSRKLDRKSAQAFMNRLRLSPDVESVEIDKRMKPTLTPNDTQYATNQWHYWDAIGGINLPAAWDQATGTGVVVAVIDTGITAHTDLNANIVAGYDFIGDLDTARDGNGRDSNPADPGDYVAVDECGVGEPADDSSWHGTHVAGTVAAVTNNNLGVAGVAFNAKVMPLRVLGPCGGYNSDIADAIVWAAGGPISGVPANGNPVEVINMSLGGVGACSSATQQAINFAVNAGVVVVVAAGNESGEAANFEPASCQNVIVVGATGKSGERATYSNFGPTVDVSAPGGSSTSASYVRSTYNTGKTTVSTEGYAGYRGTSMATPHVAGTVALMQSARVSSPAAVESILKNTARTLPVACPEGCGKGIINASAAIGGAVTGVLTISDQSLVEGNSGTKLFSFTVNLSKAMPTQVSFNVATTNGTATASSDYVPLSLTGQSIAAGATSKAFTVTVNGDASPEAAETFFVNVSNVVGITVADSQGQGTILNDDAIPLTNGVPVGSIGGTTGQGFYYSLVVPAGRTSLTITTTGGTGDVDLYVRLGALPSTTVSDCASEGADTVESCVISNPAPGTYYIFLYAYAGINGVSLTAQYLPVSPPPPALPTLSIADVALTEGNSGTKLATFTVSLSASSTSAVSFDVYTNNGTASPGSDFVTKSVVGQTIAAGVTTSTFAVTINGDTTVEEHETFTVNLVNPVNATLADAMALGRITNDDTATLSVSDATITEGNAGLSTASFVVRLSSPMPTPVTFNVATSNGSAIAGSDYVARTQTARYLDAGRSSVTFEVAINGDTAVEPGETINVTVSGVSGAILGDGTAVGTILNDDAGSATISRSDF